MGKYDDAIRALDTLAQLTGRSSFALGGLGWIYAQTGRTGEALKILEELQGTCSNAVCVVLEFRGPFILLSERWTRPSTGIEKAVDEREPLMLHIHVHPNYDPLRTHPRYKALLRKMNLEP